MSVRVERIQVEPGGPLRDTIDWRCKGLTLVYGPNETGKSYVVEFLIECLFRTGTRTGHGWNLRQWHARGGVTLSGILDEPVKMTVSKKDKLDKIWESDSRGLPDDLCRLLVVTQGTTRLSENDLDDGIDEELLHSFFSGQKLIATIRKNRKSLPASASSATFEAGTISGDGRWGELGAQEKCRDEIRRIESLVSRFNEGISHGAIAALTTERAQLNEQVTQLEEARQHHANELGGQLKTFREELETLPALEDVEQLGAAITTVEHSRNEMNDLQATEEDHAQQLENLEWLQLTKLNYERILSARPVSTSSPWPLIAAVVVMALGIVAGLFSQKLLLGLMSVAAASLFGFHVWRSRQQPVPEPDDPVEIDRIGKEHERRFSEPLGDLASIEQKIQSLTKIENQSELLAEQLTTRKNALRSETGRIGQLLTRWTGETIEQSDWADRLDELRQQRQQVAGHVQHTADELNRLGIEPDNQATEKTTIAWDARTLQQLTDRKQQLDKELTEATTTHAHLLEEARNAVSADPTANWETILAALEESLETQRTENRRLTARMIAQATVHRVLEEVETEDAERIGKGLQRPEISDSLQLMSPRYLAMRSGDEGLLVVDGDENEWPVKNLSTGAREQVFLGVRLGFARLALGNQPAFLILDDAFQHSDWDRRQRLVEQAVTLVEAGWQVLYFTMDDHIRDLFDSAGEQLGDRYVSLVLPQTTSPTNGD